MPLPGDFVSLMRSQYGDAEAGDLCRALECSEAPVSVRLNRRKMHACMSAGDVRDICEHFASVFRPVPWCPDAWYLPRRPAFTFDPMLHAGVYYVQEASSMFVADMLRRHLPLGGGEGAGPVTALDLCAAPGGKSTLLAGLLPQGSTLVSNEVMPKRAQVLAENMTKWTGGMPDGGYPVLSIVTGNQPADFAALAGQFDLLLADVPCSGEGMFRKDRRAIADWSLDNVEMCRQRQREILRDILPVLRPGGLLLYSTCTFNHYEDEENARHACMLMGGDLLEERHFLPGRDCGEGFYVAAIRKPASGGLAPAPRLQARECARRFLRVLYDGSRDGSGTSALPRIALSYDQALQYLRREVVRVEAPRGMVTLCYEGFPLGQGKSVGSRINNLYPSEWRIRSGYTTPFCLFDEVLHTQGQV